MVRKSAVVMFLWAVVLLLCLASCNGDSGTNPEPAREAGLPTVTTDTLQTIGLSGVWVVGSITDDGGAEVTDHGACWSTTSWPTLADSKVSWGTGGVQISGWALGLDPGTHYFLRAYATNSQGTAYGDQLEFTTLPPLDIVTDVDGNIYHTVTIGNQVWMVENLKATHFKDGTPIANVLAEDWYGYPFAAYCNYLDNPSWSTDYGRLYNWYAVVDPKGLAPEGWRVANDGDWKVLEMTAGLSPMEADLMSAWRGTDEGGKLKEAGIDHWYSPNTAATDEFGFSALPGGYHNDGGGWGSIQAAGFFWTSRIYDGEIFEFDGYFRRLDASRGGIFRGHLPKGTGMSVRCIKQSK